MMTAPRIFGIAGWKNSGKTGLAVRLVTELTRRGYSVSTIKHAHHDFDIDKVGADSFRHREAGAHEVTIVSGTRYAIMHELRGGARAKLRGNPCASRALRSRPDRRLQARAGPQDRSPPA